MIITSGPTGFSPSYAMRNLRNIHILILMLFHK